MADIDFNALAQAYDTTWGRASTPKTASFSVKISMLGTDRLLVSYAAIVNFTTENQMVERKRAYAEESAAIVAAKMKDIKARYKDLTGESLKASELTSTDSLEIVNFNVHNPRRAAYYRLRVVFELS